MSMPESERILDRDCPYCLLQREIIAVKFSLLKPCAALFVCPSCGSTFADDERRKRGRSWHLKACRPGSGVEIRRSSAVYRQAQIYARQGIELDRSTLADWVFATPPLRMSLVHTMSAMRARSAGW